jgi:hypothetical protein
MIDERDGNGFKVVLGGNTNRNEQSLEDKFNKIVEGLNRTQSNQKD